MAVSSSKLRKYPTTSPRPAPRMVATPKPSPKRPSEAPAWSIMTPSAAMRTNASAARSGPKAGPKVGPSSSRVVASCQRATKPPTPSQRRPWDRMSATRFLKPNPSNLYHFFTFKIIVGAIELGETPHLLQSHLHQLVVQEIVCHVLWGKTGKEGAVALHAGHLHLFHHPLGGRTELVSYTHLRAHETKAKIVCRLLLEKKKKKKKEKEKKREKEEEKRKKERKKRKKKKK